jgi:ring-1,2-phenylacetyl-CoA epoxidase subunit PaaD
VVNVAMRSHARSVAGAVTDPELPLLTLEELGVLGDVAVADDGAVTIGLTPTYSGCPAMDAMRRDVIVALQAAGYLDVEVRIDLAPAWSSDRITDSGRRKLAEAGIVPPGPATPTRTETPIPVNVRPVMARLRCPQCGSPDTEQTSPFGATACKSLHRCRSCAEPFEHFKAL